MVHRGVYVYMHSTSHKYIRSTTRNTCIRVHVLQLQCVYSCTRIHVVVRVELDEYKFVYVLLDKKTFVHDVSFMLTVGTARRVCAARPLAAAAAAVAPQGRS